MCGSVSEHARPHIVSTKRGRAGNRVPSLGDVGGRIKMAQAGSFVFRGAGCWVGPQGTAHVRLLGAASIFYSGLCHCRGFLSGPNTDGQQQCVDAPFGQEAHDDQVNRYSS